MNTLDAGCKEAYVLTNKNKVYMQATINECGIIHCDRIMNWHNKDDEESKLLTMWSEE